MNSLNINSIAALKRFMVVGQKWDCIQPETGFAPGVRELAVKNSVGIGFKTPKGISYLNWPKAKEVLFIADPSNPEKVKFKVAPEESPNLYLIYTIA